MNSKSEKSERMEHKDQNENKKRRKSGAGHPARCRVRWIARYTELREIKAQRQM